MTQSVHLPSRRLFLGGLACGLGTASFFTVRGAVRRGAAGPHAAPDRGAVLPGQAAARHRQRPDHHQQLDHAGRRRDHPPDRPGAERQRRADQGRRGRNLAVRRQRGVHPQPRQRAEEGQARQEFPGVRPLHHRLEGRVPLPHHQAGAVPRPTGPHIHFKVKKGGRELLTTQLFINGHAGNKRDGVFRGVRDPLDRELVLVDFKPIKESKIGELAAQFDIVIGLTPAEGNDRRQMLQRCPSPRYSGRGVGGEGRKASQVLAPHPSPPPLSPEYRGEGR